MPSLIDRATIPSTTTRKSIVPAEEEPHDLKRADEFLAQLATIVTGMLVPAEDSKAWKQAKYRTRLRVSKWHLGNLVMSGEHHGVSEATWEHMVRAALAEQKKNVDNQQGNGEWKLTDAEYDLRRARNGEDLILLAGEWTDARGETDIKYLNGMPIADAELTAGPDLIAALKSGQSDVPELKQMIAQLIAVLAARETGGLTAATSAVLDRAVPVGADAQAEAATPRATPSGRPPTTLKINWGTSASSSATADDVPPIADVDPEPVPADLGAAERVVDEQPRAPAPRRRRPSFLPQQE